MSGRLVAANSSLALTRGFAKLSTGVSSRLGLRVSVSFTWLP